MHSTKSTHREVGRVEKSARTVHRSYADDGILLYLRTILLVQAEWSKDKPIKRKRYHRGYSQFPCTCSLQQKEKEKERKKKIARASAHQRGQGTTRSRLCHVHRSYASSPEPGLTGPRRFHTKTWQKRKKGDTGATQVPLYKLTSS